MSSAGWPYQPSTTSGIVVVFDELLLQRMKLRLHARESHHELALPVVLLGRLVATGIRS
ncbi:MAG TPA: hypothetical protein VHW04_05935 [Solirubrobacteraceae bacterium]|nr:hypothetical protein [Solirubrobacteraceae bacterium]